MTRGLLYVVAVVETMDRIDQKVVVYILHSDGRADKAVDTGVDTAESGRFGCAVPAVADMLLLEE